MLNPSRLTLPASPPRSCVVAVLIAVLVGISAGPAAAKPGAAHATNVVVTVGKPTEFSFKLSKSSALPWAAKTPSGTVRFKVTNSGALSHDFKICTQQVTSAKLLTCNGRGTKMLAPGQSTVLTIIFKQRGTYEFLCTVPGHAVAGMKGLIGIGVKL